MVQESIYRHLRKGCHEIRLLQPEGDSSDGLLKYRLEYVSLDDDSVHTFESTRVQKEHGSIRGERSSTVKGMTRLARSAARKAQRIRTVYARHKQRKTPSGEGVCNGTPPYIALSYTWGDPQDIVSIQVAGRVKTVTRNLRDALAAIRTEPRTASLPVWADAVCINQEDITERNQEVKRMAAIYRQAASVIIWLGYVPATWNFFGLSPTVNINDAVPRCLVERKDEVTENLQQEAYTSDEVLTLLAIFDRPYWRRVWILQELVTASFRDTFFFWAGGLRHISILQNVTNNFSEVVKAWLESPDITSFFIGVDASEKEGACINSESPRGLGETEDSSWQRGFIRTSADRAWSKLAQANSTSDITKRFMQAKISGQEFNVMDHLYGKSPGDNPLRPSELEQEIRSLKEVAQALSLIAKDEKWQRKRTEIKMAVTALSITVTSIITAASLEISKEEVDFGLLMSHALFGQCTDERDLVYGLLGLHRHEIVSQIITNYELPSETIFSVFSAAAIRSRGLNFWCAYSSSLSGISGSLPSWVVDLRTDHVPGCSFGQWSPKWKKFGAGGVGSSHIRFSADNGRLLCQGLLYRVDRKTPQPNYHSKDLIRQALERVVSCYAPDEEACRSILYLSSQSSSDDPEVIAMLEFCEAFRSVHSDLSVEGFQLKDLFPVLDDIVDWDQEAVSRALKSTLMQNIFITMDGKLGLGPEDIRDGDCIAVLRGCNLPVILRERKGGYGLIGTCYLDEVMLGEASGADANWKQLTIL